MKYHRILLAGATGYLGKYLIQELKKQGYYTIALARDPAKLDHLSIDEVIKAEVTQTQSLKELFTEVDCVISSIGITNQKDGLYYMDVDYQANVNLMKEAERAGTKKFIYVSVLNGQNLRELKMIEAKERFVNELKKSGIEYLIIRPNGFFSDLSEILKMAQKGKVFLFGDGEYRGNPIHGADLAEFITNNMNESNAELRIGGPDVLTQNEIARAAFEATGNKEKIVYVPIWVRNLSLHFIHWFTGQRTYGPIEFFLTVMTMNMLAPLYGNHHLANYFKTLIDTDSKHLQP